MTALLSPPNTGDVVFYHMPRVVMWMNHRSVRFYPTLNYAQLIYGSWAEYAMLNLDLLFGGDRFVNLVQWFAYVGSAVTASLIARSLGARIKGQVLAAAICCAIPVAVLEGSGAKNNCVVAFWLASATYFLLEFRRNPSWGNTLGFGAAAALAIFTKGTAYLFLPALVAAGWWVSTRPAKRIFLVRLPILASLVLVLNFPLYVRNFRLTGSPTGVGFQDLDEDLDFGNQNHSLAGIAANVVRNGALYLSSTDAVDAAVERWASRAIRALGQAPDDPRALKLPQVLGLRFRTNPASTREDMTGAPLHFLLLGLAVTLAVAGWRKYPDTAWYALGIAASFVTFCAMLRWERWGVRYQIPLLVLGSALIAVALDRYFPRVAPMAGLIALVCAMPFALHNELRPLLPIRFSHQSPRLSWSDNSILLRDRRDYYFKDLREDIEQSYIAAADAVRQTGCGRVGLDLSLEDDDYPFLAFLTANQHQAALSYSGVYNLTRSLANPDQQPPCAVVCFGCSEVKRKWAQYRSVGGRASIFGDVAVFGESGNIPNTAVVPVEDQGARMGILANDMWHKFEALKALSTKPEYAELLADEQKLARLDRTRAHEMRLLEQSLNRTVNDACVIMLYTTRLRREASEGHHLATDERAAMLAANEALERLDGRQRDRLKELDGLATGVESLRVAQFQGRVGQRPAAASR
jgi:4-amino-4-deoxy-L-arabinose transferase-like glycosyltransferase